ncbi:hypothetical protein DEU56DRAFT_981637 [Suillus clintonianus]|uniref:uncharacterized protein n=1 Tax=Suillus clintonianus TaxID=1904413 RepID=UPI001B864FCB|nr:uncharacterized protein DEU56DRAFT_981637 [Suillus clintonianus]KAG2132743.1 hypothetical protein DEU56DRAFT_981637 [Suillus clintonianus]
MLHPLPTKAVLLVIDALRFDFIAEHLPEPVFPFHHNILTLPCEFTAAHPNRSFILNVYSDPAATTLQRLKDLTSHRVSTHLPKRRGQKRKIALAGDDTWLTISTDAFQPNMTFAFDSFNVEDLHTTFTP